MLTGVTQGVHMTYQTVLHKKGFRLKCKNAIWRALDCYLSRLINNQLIGLYNSSYDRSFDFFCTIIEKTRKMEKVVRSSYDYTRHCMKARPVVDMLDLVGCPISVRHFPLSFSLPTPFHHTHTHTHTHTETQSISLSQLWKKRKSEKTREIGRKQNWEIKEKKVYFSRRNTSW